MDERKTQTDRIVVGILPEGAAGDVFLVQIHGGRIGRLFTIRGELTLGRDELNSIVLDDQSVSRRHARIVVRDGRCLVEDLGSTNGTAVNEVTVHEPTPLVNGDRLRVGGIWFRCIAGDGLEQRYHEEIHRLVIADGLTGLYNRRYLDDFLDREMARSKRRRLPLSVALVDVDHFKAINDDLGHLAGDAVLRTLSERMSREVRREELLARYGGEEFAVVFPDTPLADAYAVCERLRENAASKPIPLAEGSVSVTISVGIATTTGQGDVASLLEDADARLYEAKDAGRNTVRPRPE